MSSDTTTSIRIRLDPYLELESRKIQSSIPVDKLYTTYPVESSLFEEYDFDRREKFGLRKGLWITIIDNLPAKASFSKITAELSKFKSLSYCFNSVEFGVHPAKKSINLRFSSGDIQKLRRGLEESFSKMSLDLEVDLILGYIRKDETTVVGTSLSRGDEFVANEVEVVYPGEVVRYFLDGSSPWLIDQPLPQNPELVSIDKKGGACE